MKLKDRVAIITGAAAGIGQATARRFASEGAIVVLCDRSADAVEQEAGRLKADGHAAVAHAVDVTDRAGIDALVADLRSQFGRIDILVNNAGITQDARLARMSEAQFDKVIDVNLRGVFNCTQAVVGTMIEQERGVILNASSVVGIYGNFGQTNYAASKFGVIGITQSLAIELAKTGITVNAFCPGIIGTDMWAYNDAAWGKLLGDYKPGELMAEWVEGIPMGRAGTPEDVAGLVTFLASDDAAYITGQTVNVDGGLFMS